MNAPEPRYFFVHVDVPTAQGEDVSVALFELGAEGVEERDETTFVRGEKPDHVTLVAFFPTETDAHEALGNLPADWSPRIREVVGDAWRDAWKEHFRPFALCPRVVVYPPWEPRPEAPAGGHLLALEPGRAFGTGLHATTSLVAGWIDENARDQALLDVGTGSGILSFVALLLGASRAVGIDPDPDSIEVARENAVRNDLTSRFDASTADVASLTETYPTVVANIETPILIPLAEALWARVAPGGVLVLSGILTTQEDDIVRAYGASHHQETRRSGEWSCLTFRRTAG